MRRLVINFVVEYLHEPWHQFFGQRLPSELLVQAMRIARSKHPATEALQFRMSVDLLQQALRQTPAPMCRQNEYIGEVSECGFIGYQARKPDLRLAMINAKTE